MSNTVCPMCSSGLYHEVDRVSSQEIMAAYRQPSLGVDLSGTFGADSSSIMLYQCDSCDLRWYSPTVAGDGDFYVSLQKHDWYYQSNKPEYYFAREHVPEGGNVLEVGCGRGEFRKFLPDNTKYKGLEFNSAALQAARAQGLDVQMRPVEDEAKNCPANFDVVCHFQVLEHVTDPRSFLQACSDLLRPGGTLIVAVPSEDSFLCLAESSWLNMPPHHLTRWSDRALSRALESVGIKLQTVWHEEVAEYHIEWQRAVLTNAGLRKFLHSSPPSLVGSNLASRIARRVNMHSPWMASWMRKKALRAYPYAARGHTVCVVGRKT